MPYRPATNSLFVILIRVELMNQTLVGKNIEYTELIRTHRDAANDFLHFVLNIFIFENDMASTEYFIIIWQFNSNADSHPRMVPRVRGTANALTFPAQHPSRLFSSAICMGKCIIN